MLRYAHLLMGAVLAAGAAGAQQDVIALPSSAGQVSFPHRGHVEEFEIECGECHHDTRASKLAFPHQDYLDDFWIDCRICHRESDPTSAAVRDCGQCHHAFPAKVADESLSAKVVIHRRCWSCHETGTGAQASRSCGSCHTGPRSSPGGGRAAPTAAD